MILTARDLKKAEKSLAGILEPGRVSLVQMDNASLASIRSAAARILAQAKNQVNILVANAGVACVEELTLTEDGHELHFGTNHLGHFLLFQLLKPALLASSSPKFQSRVVMVASQAHRNKGLNESDNYNYQKGGYNHTVAYGQSKLANIYMANEIERRYGPRGLHSLSLHPGVVKTELPRNLDSVVLEQIFSHESVVKGLKSIEQGAATTILATIGKEWEGKGGIYLNNCEESKPGPQDFSQLSPGHMNHAYNPVDEKRLWGDSLHIVGIKDDM